MLGFLIVRVLNFFMYYLDMLFLRFYIDLSSPLLFLVILIFYMFVVLLLFRHSAIYTLWQLLIHCRLLAIFQFILIYIHYDYMLITIRFLSVCCLQRFLSAQQNHRKALNCNYSSTAQHTISLLMYLPLSSTEFIFYVWHALRAAAQ